MRLEAINPPQLPLELAERPVDGSSGVYTSMTSQHSNAEYAADLSEMGMNCVGEDLNMAFDPWIYHWVTMPDDWDVIVPQQV